MTDRSVAVETFKIELRRSGVLQLRRIEVRPEGGAIGCDVMGDELTEKRPSGGLRAERPGIVFDRSAVAQTTRPAERVQERLVRRKRRQIRKQARVRDGAGRARGSQLGPTGRQAMCVFHVADDSAYAARSPYLFGQ